MFLLYSVTQELLAYYIYPELGLLNLFQLRASTSIFVRVIRTDKHTSVCTHLFKLARITHEVLIESWVYFRNHVKVAFFCSLRQQNSHIFHRLRQAERAIVQCDLMYIC